MANQISPNPNPVGSTYAPNDGDYNSELFNNYGIFLIKTECSIVNARAFYNGGKLNNNGHFVNNGIFITKDSGLTKNLGTFINNETFDIWSGTDSFVNSTGGTLFNNSVINNSQQISNFGTFHNKKLAIVNNYALFLNSGVVINDGIIDNTNGTFKGVPVKNEGSGKVIHPKLTGTGKIIGDYESRGVFSPGNSAGGHFIDGDLLISSTSSTVIQLGGLSDTNRDSTQTDYDFIDVAGDLLIDGGSLEVSLIDDFKIERGQKFMISDVDGDLSGEFKKLGEGSSVGLFDSMYSEPIDLFISYQGGDGNDICLYTMPQTNADMIFSVA